MIPRKIEQTVMYRINLFVASHERLYTILGIIITIIILALVHFSTWLKLSSEKVKELHNTTLRLALEINSVTTDNSIAAIVQDTATRNTGFIEDVIYFRRKALKKELKNLSLKHWSINTMILDRKGTPLVSYISSNGIKAKKQNYCSCRFFQEAVNGSSQIVIEEFPDKNFKGLFYASPIVNHGSILGILVMVRPMDEVITTLERYPRLTFLIRPDGKIEEANSNQSIDSCFQNNNDTAGVPFSSNLNTSFLPMLLHGEQSFLNLHNSKGKWKLLLIDNITAWYPLWMVISLSITIILTMISILLLFKKLSLFIVTAKNNEERSLLAEEMLNDTQAASLTGTWALTAPGNNIWWSPQLYKLLDISPGKENPTLEDVLALIDENDKITLQQKVEEAFKGIEFSQSFTMIPPSGKKIHFFIMGKIIKKNMDNVTIGGTIQDITIRRNNELKIMKLFMSVEQSPVSIVITDPLGNIEYVNPQFTRLTGYSQEEVMGENPRVLKSGFNDDALYTDLWETISSGNKWEGELCNKGKDGSLFWERAFISPIHDNRGTIISYVGVKEDFTLLKKTIEELKASEERLTVLSRTDGLTGIFNRRYFFELSELEFSRSVRYGKIFSCLLFDIDRFKNINDTFGHDAGDMVLKTLSDIALSIIRDIDTLGRVGGEEFAALLPETDNAGALKLAERIRSAVESYTFMYNESRISITISIGVSVINNSFFSFSDMYRDADKGLYHAKENGRNQVSRGDFHGE